MRILVIEDEPSVAEALVYLLRAGGHQVRSAGDGVLGLARFEDDEPDLVLLDLMLPRLNGLEVARRMRAHSDVPIIMLTARSGEAEKLVGFAAGADDYLTKPFSQAELMARIAAVTRGRTGDPAASPIRAGIPDPRAATKPKATKPKATKPKAKAERRAPQQAE